MSTHMISAHVLRLRLLYSSHIYIPDTQPSRWLACYERYKHASQPSNIDESLSWYLQHNQLHAPATAPSLENNGASWLLTLS